MDKGDDERWEDAQEGAELVLEGSIDAAVVELERVLAEDAANEHAYFYLGNAHFEAERFDKALKAYLGALERKPKYLGAMVGAGHALRMLGRYDEALKIGRHALLLKRDDADVLYLLGVIHFQRGDAQEAKLLLDKFLESRPEVEAAIEVEGMLQVLAGQLLPMPGSEDN